MLEPLWDADAPLHREEGDHSSAMRLGKTSPMYGVAKLLLAKDRGANRSSSIITVSIYEGGRCSRLFIGP